MTISPYSKLNGYYVVTKNGKELEKGRVPFPSREFDEVLKKFELNSEPTLGYNFQAGKPIFSEFYRSKSNFTELELVYLDLF